MWLLQETMGDIHVMVWWYDSLGVIKPRFTHETTCLEMGYTSVGGSMSSCCKLNLSSGISSPLCDCEDDSSCEQ